jgi:hypothetical protein
MGQRAIGQTHAERLPHQDIGTRNARVAEQRVQLVRDTPRIPWLRAIAAPTDASAVISARAGGSGNLRLNIRPIG